MKRLVCTLFVLLISCGGDEHSKPDCDKEDRDGTYRVTTTYNGGSCGDLGTFYVQFSKGADTTYDCIVNYEEWTNDDCTLQRNLTCTVLVHDSGTGTTSTVTVDWNQTSTQQDDSGGVFYANVSMTQRGGSGFNCSGTYFFTYTRVSR